jgi:hypothetical protein
MSEVTIENSKQDINDDLVVYGNLNQRINFLFERISGSGYRT